MSLQCMPTHGAQIPTTGHSHLGASTALARPQKHTINCCNVASHPTTRLGETAGEPKHWDLGVGHAGSGGLNSACFKLCGKLSPSEIRKSRGPVSGISMGMYLDVVTRVHDGNGTFLPLSGSPKDVNAERTYPDR